MGRLERAVRNSEQGRDIATVSLLRTLALEDWLRSLRDLETESRDRRFPNRCHSVVLDPTEQLLGRENQKKGGDTHELHQTRDIELADAAVAICSEDSLVKQSLGSDISNPHRETAMAYVAEE